LREGVAGLEAVYSYVAKRTKSRQLKLSRIFISPKAALHNYPAAPLTATHSTHFTPKTIQTVTATRSLLAAKTKLSPGPVSRVREKRSKSIK